MTGQVGGELMHGDERGARLLADPNGIADMVLVTMGQGDMRHPLDDVLHRNVRFFEGRIAGQERIDQDTAIARFDPKTRMAEPRNLHRLTFRYLSLRYLNLGLPL